MGETCRVIIFFAFNVIIVTQLVTFNIKVLQ